MDRNPNTFRNRVVGVAMATVLAFGVIAGVAAGDAGAQVSSKYDASIDSTIADIQAFWTSTMPAVYGQQYEAIPTDRVYPYSQDNPPPNCEDGGQTKAPYEQVAGNAFYCSNGDFVAYDEQGLLPKLRDNFGEFAVGLVFAHELGHAVQARVGYNPPSTVYYEQQADCFAGAWAQHVADSNDSNVHLASQRPRHRARRIAHTERPVGHRRLAGRRARQRLRPGQRVPGRVRGRRAGVRRLSEQPALDHRDRLHQLPGPGDRRQPARSTR